jgi:peptidoglycan hydrolase-like protein with peptidoglycan-binding domain
VPKSNLLVLVIFAIGCSSLAATPAKPHKRRHPATTAAPSAAKPHAAAAVKGTKASVRRKGKVVARVPARSYQQAPTPDRYKEIQQALTSKGYLHGEPNGQWGPDSTDALKRFQADQNLMPDGKINSLSLIALGLGPKRLTAKSDPAPAPAPPAANPQ